MYLFLAEASKSLLFPATAYPKYIEVV